MDPRTRIMAIRLAEKMERRPEYVAKIGASMTGLPAGGPGRQTDRKTSGSGRLTGGTQRQTA